MQRETLNEVHVQLETSALLSKGIEEMRCTHCGNRGHQKDKCWQIIGYPSWHPRSRKFPQKRGGRGPGGRGPGRGQRLMNKSGEAKTRFSAQAQCDSTAVETSCTLPLTPQQIEQLLKLIPSTSHTSQALSSKAPSSKASNNTYDTDEEIDYNFASMVYSCAATTSSAWILDIGATDQMSPVASSLINHKVHCPKQHIKLLNYG